MISEMSLPKYFWMDVINTACHILNRMVIQTILEKTPYELLKDKKPNIPYFCLFCCKCFILNNKKKNLGKFDAKSDESIFIGFSSSSKTYKAYNHRTSSIVESIHVTFDESLTQNKGKGICSDVSGVITENLIDDNIHKENPPPKIT